MTKLQRAQRTIPLFVKAVEECEAESLRGALSDITLRATVDTLEMLEEDAGRHAASRRELKALRTRLLRLRAVSDDEVWLRAQLATLNVKE